MLKLVDMQLTSVKTYNGKIGEQLNISKNILHDLEGIESWSEQLKWLNASHNQIKGVKHLKTCTNLKVLNLSHNQLTSVKGLKKLKLLNALILNNNELKCLDGMSSLVELNTLILSSNNLEIVDVSQFKKLQKFSASHNKLKDFPSLHSQKELKDLKLNDNEIERIPDWFISSCIRMKTLDLGNNNLKDVDSISSLCKLPYLENLNLKGNPLCNAENYHLKMREIFPKLKLLDFKNLSDLYYKVLSDQSGIRKPEVEPTLVKDEKNIIPTTATTATEQTAVSTNRGFKSSKSKREAETDIDEPKCINKTSVVENAVSKNTMLEKEVTEQENVTALSEPNQKTKKRRLKQDGDWSVNEVGIEAKEEHVSSNPKKRRKKKKKTLEKLQEDGSSTCSSVTKKLREGGVKSSKKTGVVQVVKKKKTANVFDPTTLIDSTTSFGTGQNVW